MPYHITLSSKLPYILIDGLLPMIGERSEKMGEAVACVFLFPTLDDAENAWTNWLGEELEDAGDVALLEVTLPNDAQLTVGAGYEIAVLSSISPQHIHVITKDLDYFDWQSPVKISPTPG